MGCACVAREVSVERGGMGERAENLSALSNRIREQHQNRTSTQARRIGTTSHFTSPTNRASRAGYPPRPRPPRTFFSACRPLAHHSRRREPHQDIAVRSQREATLDWESSMCCSSTTSITTYKHIESRFMAGLSISRVRFQEDMLRMI